MSKTTADRQGLIFDIVIAVMATQLAALHIISDQVWLIVIGPMVGAVAARESQKRKSDSEANSRGGSAALSIGLGIAYLLSSRARNVAA